MGCKHPKIGQICVLCFFLNGGSHKTHLNIEILQMFFSLMINMRTFFEFNIILLCLHGFNMHLGQI